MTACLGGSNVGAGPGVTSPKIWSPGRTAGQAGYESFPLVLSDPLQQGVASLGRTAPTAGSWAVRYRHDRHVCAGAERWLVQQFDLAVPPPTRSLGARDERTDGEGREEVCLGLRRWWLP
jgi:hypothetical protein